MPIRVSKRLPVSAMPPVRPRPSLQYHPSVILFSVTVLGEMRTYKGLQKCAASAARSIRPTRKDGAHRCCMRYGLILVM